MSNPSSKQRREPRYPAQLPITLKSGSRVHHAYTSNVSYRGLFACTDSPPVLRQLITIEAVLPPNDTPFSTHAMSVFVRSLADEDGEPPGVGIQFYAQGGSDRRNWEAFIDYVKSGNQVGTAPGDQAAAQGSQATAAPKAARPEPPPVRRHYPRYAARLTVRPRSLRDLEVLYSRDVSKGGMFLATRQQIPSGTELQLEVYHPETSESFALSAIVRRVSMQHPEGVGVEFTDLDDARRDEFLQFIRDGIPVVGLDDVDLIDENDPGLA